VQQAHHKWDEILLPLIETTFDLFQVEIKISAGYSPILVEPVLDIAP
jgi:hypothetical protein